MPPIHPRWHPCYSPIQPRRSPPLMENLLTPELEALRYIRYEAQDRIGYITLNRPDKRNALNADVVTELKQAFEFAENDQAVNVVVLRAAGDVFCAGADLA